MYVNNKYASHGYALELRQDGTFSWNEAVAEFEPRCKGKWKLISEKMIQLKCDSADIGEVLSSSYLNEQEKTLIVKGKKLQYKNNIVLRKVKS